jgi:hypothetical protein
MFFKWEASPATGRLKELVDYPTAPVSSRIPNTSLSQLKHFAVVPWIIRSIRAYVEDWIHMMLRA